MPGVAPGRLLPLFQTTQQFSHSKQSPHLLELRVDDQELIFLLSLLRSQSPMGSPDNVRQPGASGSCLPPIRSLLEGLDDTLEELCDLFMDRSAPIQLVIVTGPPGSGPPFLARLRWLYH